MVAQNGNLDDPRLPLFLSAVEKATQYIINHPDDAWALFIRGREAALNNELNRRAWADTLPRFATRPAAMDFGRYARFSALKDQGLRKAICKIHPAKSWFRPMDPDLRWQQSNR